MKFEFSMDVKGVPTARVDCKFECSSEELVTLISDPVYQALGAKLVNEVSFKPQRDQANHNNDRQQNRPNRNNGNRHDHGGKVNQPNDRVDALRKVMETEHKLQANHNEMTNKVISIMQARLAEIVDLIKNKQF